MNPSVEAAWIAASVGVLSLVGTVIIAIVGYRNTRVVAVEAARNERLVGKIADTYEGVVTALIRRQAERREAATFYREPESAERMHGPFKRLDPAWFEAEGRVTAYSSPQVRRGLTLVRRADEEVSMYFEMWQQAKRRASEARESGRPVPEATSSGELREQMIQILELAEKVDDALIDLIRAELQGRSAANPTERLNSLAQNRMVRWGIENS